MLFGLSAHVSNLESLGAVALVTTAVIRMLMMVHAAVTRPRDARQWRRPQALLLLVGLGCALFDPRFIIVSDFWPENRQVPHLEESFCLRCREPLVWFIRRRVENPSGQWESIALLLMSTASLPFFSPHSQWLQRFWMRRLKIILFAENSCSCNNAALVPNEAEKKT